MAPKKVILLTTLAAMLCLATAARAAIQFDAFLGYDDLLPEQSWFPITCELHNDGPAFNAVVEIEPQDFGEGQVRRFPLDLPTNTRKRIFIPMFSAARSWNVRLLDESGKVRAEQLLDRGQVVKNNLPLVAGLARVTAGLPVFPDFPPSYGGVSARYGAARLQPALFPDNPLALEGIDLLYLSSERAANMTVGQVNALMEWLQRGGHLVVGVEQLTDVNGTPWLRELLPCELTSTVTLNSHAALEEWAKNISTISPNAPQQQKMLQRRQGPAANPTLKGAAPAQQNLPSMEVTPLPNNPKEAWVDDSDFVSAPLPAAVGTLREGSYYLFGEASAPLAVEGYRGRGKITVLTFDPEREPFISWKNRGWLWAGLAGIPASAFQIPYNNIRASRLSTDGVFGAMIDTKQVRKLPLGWLLALLTAYLIVIGPLDQYWLKRINRQMLTWVTFPCYVLIFSGLIYYIGFHLRAGELEWNQLDVVDILPDAERAVLRGQTYVSIYSPVNSGYPLAGEEKFAILRGEFAGTFGGSTEGSRATIVQTGNNFEAQAYVPVWTSQLLVSDWIQPTAAPLKMTVKRSGAVWTANVANNLNYDLPSVHAVFGGMFYDLGLVKAGESKEFTLKASQGTSVDQMARNFQGAFRNAVMSRHNSFGNNEVNISDIAAGAMAASFIGYVNRDLGPGGNGWDSFSAPAGLDLSRFADRNYGILLVWDAGHTLTPPLNRFQPRRLHRNTLLRLVVPVDIKS
jgi:hypothetical protein